MNTNTIIRAQLFEYSNNTNIRGNTDVTFPKASAKYKRLKNDVNQTIKSANW